MAKSCPSVMQASLLAKQAITGLRRSHAASLVPLQGSIRQNPVMNAPDYRIFWPSGAVLHCFWSAVPRIALPSLVPLIYPVSVEQELPGMQVNAFANR